MAFGVTRWCRNFHGMRSDELAPNGAGAEHGLQAIEKVLADNNDRLATTCPSFCWRNGLDNWRHSTRINAWKNKINRFFDLKKEMKSQIKNSSGKKLTIFMQFLLVRAMHAIRMSRRTFDNEAVFATSDFTSMFGIVVDKHVFRNNMDSAIIDWSDGGGNWDLKTAHVPRIAGIFQAVLIALQEEFELISKRKRYKVSK